MIFASRDELRDVPQDVRQHLRVRVEDVFGEYGFDYIRGRIRLERLELTGATNCDGQIVVRSILYEQGCRCGMRGYARSGLAGNREIDA